MTMTINGRKITAETLTELRISARRFIGTRGSSQVRIGPISGHATAASMSYNGRFWSADDRCVPASDPHACAIHVTSCYECGRAMQASDVVRAS